MRRANRNVNPESLNPGRKIGRETEKQRDGRADGQGWDHRLGLQEPGRVLSSF